MVTIILSTYNGEKYIKNQIDSLLRQTYKNWKLVVRDDGSKDSTLEILESYRKKYPNQIQILPDISNKGVKESFFSLIWSLDLNTDYLMFCDQDDIWLDNKVERTLFFMKEKEKESKKAILLHTDQFIVNDDLNIISKSSKIFFNINIKNNNFENLIINPIVTGCTMMVNRKLLEELQRLKLLSLQKIYLHDYAISLIASLIGEIYYLPESTMYYRVHSNNVTVSLNKRSLFNKIIDLKKVYYSRIYLEQAIFILEVYKPINFEEKLYLYKKVIENYNQLYIKRLYYWWKTKLYKNKSKIRSLKNLFYI